MCGGVLPECLNIAHYVVPTEDRRGQKRVVSCHVVTGDFLSKESRRHYSHIYTVGIWFTELRDTEYVKKKSIRARKDS